MSKTEEKKPDEEKKDVAKKEKGPPDEIAETRKKRKLVVLLGMTTVISIAAAAGGFFVYKSFLQKPHSMAAKKDEATTHEQKDGHSEDKTGTSVDEKSTPSPSENKDAGTHADNKDAKQDSKHDEKKDSNTTTPKKADEKHQETNTEAQQATKEPRPQENKDSDKKAANSANEEKSLIKMFQSDETFGETYTLPKMDLNLGNPLENRYLRIGLSIEYSGGKDQMEELKKREPQIRDIVISSVSTRTRLDLLTDKGKEKLRRELISKMNETFSRPVKTIYFTDFLVE